MTIYLVVRTMQPFGTKYVDSDSMKIFTSRDDAWDYAEQFKFGSVRVLEKTVA